MSKIILNWNLLRKVIEKKNFFDFCCSYVLRMKEYERERRLMVRRERLAKKNKQDDEVLAA